MKTEQKIRKLKKKAAKHYREYCRLVDDLSCGCQLAEYVSSDILKHKLECNAAMDELEKLDSSTPSARL